MKDKSNKQWHGLLKVFSLEKIRDGVPVERYDNLLNTLHSGGENLVLSVLFGEEPPPTNYYLGLDNRQTVSIGDTLASLIGEPVGHGYIRQQIASSNFVISQNQSAYVATSQVVAFAAAAGQSWGPVINLFMATSLDNSGTLISSVPMVSPLSLADTESVLMRIGFALSNP